MKHLVALALSVSFISTAIFAAKPAPPPAPFVPAIAYIQAKTMSPASDLMLMSADGSQSKVLVAGTKTAGAGSPSFSPDGSMIVYRFGPALYVVPTAGGTPWKIVDLAQGHGWNTPAWSPDGRFILYADSTEPSAICGCPDRDLFLIEVDSAGHAVAGSKLRLTATSSLIEYQPSWSRDGSRFVAKVWINSNEEQLFVFDFDATTQSITGSWSLTAGLGKMFFGPWRAQWNKTSTTFPNDVIVFSAHFPNDGSNYDLWYIDANTLLAGHLIATRQNYEGSPSFSPTDGRLVFHNENAGTNQSPHDLSIIENAADLITGAATTPVLTHTVATTSGKIVDVFECDWKPVP